MDTPDTAPAEVTDFEKYRERIGRFLQGENPAVIAGAAVIFVAFLFALLWPKKEETKPIRKVVRIHERIIERPVRMRDLKDDTRSAKEKTKSEGGDLDDNARKQMKQKPEDKPEDKQNEKEEK